MAISFSRPDPSSPAAIASATFTPARRGFEQNEVRELLRMVAAELARLQEREKFLERELRVAQRSVPNAAVALDDEVVTRLLGEEAARILQTAREAATQIRVRAEEGAARVLREADEEAQRVRQEADLEAARRRADAAADAESELAMAKQQGRDMVEEARAYRERVLSELARRRELARQQIEQLVHGRDRLVQAFERARLVAVDVMAEITPLGEPAEYVNLAPTTGPVPVMVPATPARQAETTPERTPQPPAMSPSPTQDVDEHDIAAETAESDPVEVEQDDPAESVAPVVALFAGELERQSEAQTEREDATGDTGGEPAAVEDLFARLRAARADAVVRRATDEAPPSVFSPSPPEPVDADAGDEVAEDNVFTRRDAALTPLIVAAARKLKRVLADEQNDVLSTLRRSEPVRSLDTLLPWESEQVERYASVVRADLEAAALAGAASVDSGTKATHRKDIARANALRPAIDALAATVVVPLRDRIARAVDDADGDNEAIADIVRSAYREWKTQRIDEHLDDVVHTAFGRGAYAALAPGTPVCWLVDPHGPACPDAEDNALAGALPAGAQFPTDHVCAPAHPGCRCVLALADQ